MTGQTFLRGVALACFALFASLEATPAAAKHAAGVGQRCGGLIGIPCAKGLWCQMPTGACRIADGFGRCAVRPQICTHIFRPVCGCNGKTYSNDCVRQAAMVNKKHNGACKRHYH